MPWAIVAKNTNGVANLEPSTLFGIAGLLIGVVGIAVAIFEGRKYRGPKLSYQYDGFRIIRSYDAVFPDSIEVTFGGNKVPNLTHSQIIIWNHGRGPITRTDVSSQDKLYISFGEEFKILQAEIVKKTSEPNDVRITYSPRDSRVDFEFEFLDSQDGILLSVWHTSPKTIPRLYGTIINKNAGPFRLGRFLGPRPNVPDKENNTTLIKRFKQFQHIYSIKPVLFSWALMIAGLITITSAVGIWIVHQFQIDHFVGFSFMAVKWDLKAPPFALAVPGLMYFILGASLWKQVRRRFPKALVPDEYQNAEGS